MDIRPEQPGDIDAIRAVIDAAFAPKTYESRIVDVLRESDRWLPDFSLVAVDDGVVVGHCVSSIGDLIADDGSIGRSSRSDRSRSRRSGRDRGSAGRMLAATAERATAAGWPVIVLLGHSDYYPRYGYERASPLGLVAPGDVPDPAWMALRLPAWTPDVRGRMRFPAAFDIDDALATPVGDDARPHSRP